MNCNKKHIFAEAQHISESDKTTIYVFKSVKHESYLWRYRLDPIDAGSKQQFGKEYKPVVQFINGNITDLGKNMFKKNATKQER